MNNNYFILGSKEEFERGRMQRVSLGLGESKGRGESSGRGESNGRGELNGRGESSGRGELNGHEAGLVVSENDGSDNENAFYLSPIYDAKEEGVVWHRMVLESQAPDIPVTVSIYSTDNPERIRPILQNKQLPFSQVIQKCKKYLSKTFGNKKDVLLHEVKGRYIWFLLEFSQRSGQTIKISRIRLYFPKDTWLKYLPEVYQHHSESREFLEAFLGVFQSLYQDMNEEIQHSFAHFQPDICKEEYLSELGRWLHRKNTYLWKEKELRLLLSESIEDYGKRGTVKGLLKAVSLYTGAPAYVVEQHKLEPERTGKGKEKRRALVDALYGTSPYSFTLLLKEEQVKTDKELKALKEIVADMTPAQMKCNLVVLRPYLFLGRHSYLGMNSYLGRYQPFDTEQTMVLPFCSLQNTKTKGAM